MLIFLEKDKNQVEKGKKYNRNQKYEKGVKAKEQKEKIYESNKNHNANSKKYNEYKQNGYNSYQQNGYNSNDQYNYNGYVNYKYKGYSDKTQWDGYGYKRRYPNLNYNYTKQSIQLIEVELPDPINLKAESTNEKTPNQEVQFETVQIQNECQQKTKELKQIKQIEKRDDDADDEIFNKNILIEENQSENSYTKQEKEPIPSKLTEVGKNEKIIDKSKNVVFTVETNVAFTLNNVIPPKKEIEQPKDNNTEPQLKNQTYLQPQHYTPYNACDMPYMMMPYMMPEPPNPNDINNQMKQPMYFPYFYYPMAEQNQRTDFRNMKQQQQRFYRQPPQYPTMPYIPQKK